MPYISEVVDLKQMRPGCMNMIVSGCGTGKSVLVIEHLFEQLPHLKPSDVMFVTSRAITRNQQSLEPGMLRFNWRDINRVRHWNGEEEKLLVPPEGMAIMLYQDYINCIRGLRPKDEPALQNAKLVIFDECHAIYTDNQFQYIDSLRDSLPYAINNSSFTGQLFLGLTATPDIFLFQRALGYKINLLNSEPLFLHKAKELICTTDDSMPYLIGTNKLAGRTIVLVDSFTRALEAAKVFPNPFILTGKGHEMYDEKTMGYVRETMIREETIPEFFDGKPIDTLITTSTLREGVTLREKCNVRNFVSYLTDPTNIVQICGRARYSPDKLIVVLSHRRGLNRTPDSYEAINHCEFRNFLYNNGGYPWFEKISPVVETDIAGVKKLIIEGDLRRFVLYMNDKWLIPPGMKMDDPDIKKYHLHKEEDLREIVNVADECGVFDKGIDKSKKTPNRVIRFMRNSLGYEVISDRYRRGGERYTYKLLIDWDESIFDEEEQNA